MKAQAVIGAAFGDCGKGLITDYICSKGNVGVVVRFNSGAQAGHTVFTPQGKRHVFSHFGSGSFLGVPTFLSQFFVCNPILFWREFEELHRRGVKPDVYAHPDCLITTFADMFINQALEDKRGSGRHGSCGVGFGETIERCRIDRLKITMADLWNGSNLEPKLVEICTKYAKYRGVDTIKDYEPMIAHFQKACEKFAAIVGVGGIGQCKDPLFEGAQGLLLDMDNREYFPNVTRSNTGIKNVRILCKQAGIENIDAYYVSRTYLTRHGAGKLPGEDTRMSFADQTNNENPWQGKLRFAPLDAKALVNRIYKDFGSADCKIALTHCDQLPAPMEMRADLYSYGPTRLHVSPSR